jgi:dimethylaniline monooxygenase (N-oxide forming)
MRVCVVGAGPSGLTTVKQLLDEGHDVVCFEQNFSIGGIWYRHDNDRDQMKAYDNLVLTISSKLMAFSDHIPEGKRLFFTREQYLAYLESYADRYHLRGRVRCGMAVTDVHKLADGTWRVTTSAKGVTAAHEFDAVAVCSGPFQSANTDVAGLENFSGDVVHSSAFRNADAFRGRRVLVIGLAESGADVLRQISDVADHCTLSLRSYSFLLPRLFSGKYSTDATTARSHHYEMWVRATDTPFAMRAIFGDSVASRLIFSATTTLYGALTVAWRMLAGAVNVIRGPESQREAGPAQLNNLGEPMHPLKLDLSTEWTEENMEAIDEWNRRSHDYQGNWSPRIIFCKNVSFIPNIVNGRIAVNESGIDRIDGRVVHFKDATSREFDTIVLCTGFHKDFSRLGAALSVEDNNVRNLYKHAFYPQHGGRLALIGFVRPFSGGIPICAEMQARYFALLCSDKLRLPANLDEVIQKEKIWEERSTSLSPSHTEAIPAQSFFLDSIAREIGCLMSLKDLVMSPRLLVRHWFYPFNQACYRLVGPHDMHDSAMRELMNDEPGPMGSNVGILFLAGSSLLPRFMHPRNMDRLSMPGEPRPPKMHPSARSHFLSRGSWKNPARSAKSFEAA